MMEVEYRKMMMDVEYQKLMIEEAIAKARKIMEGCPGTTFNIEQALQYHRCAYELICKSKEDATWLSERFKKTMEESIVSIVIPYLVDKCDDSLLLGLILMWSNYKLMARWLCKFFEYLDRRIPVDSHLNSLDYTFKNCFQELVFKKLYPSFRVAVISMIKQERMGLHIDQDLVKSVLLLFMEISECGESYYEDFERKLLHEIAALYYQLAQEWLLFYSTEDYIQKVYWCLNQEKGRASYYLSSTTELKFLEVIRYQLLDKTMDKLIEKKKGEDCGLVTDYQEMLSKCAGMNIGEGTSASALQEWLSSSLASSTRLG